jgi:hypothetical protein
MKRELRPETRSVVYGADAAQPQRQRLPVSDNDDRRLVACIDRRLDGCAKATDHRVLRLPSVMLTPGDELPRELGEVRGPHVWPPRLRHSRIGRQGSTAHCNHFLRCLLRP